MSAGWQHLKGSGCTLITTGAASGGTSTKDVEAVPSVAAKAPASAATLTSQAQQLPHFWQQQQYSGLLGEL